ncbi:hypothetical protein BRADI_2g57288v3 [Brachypodium distachyon]|uniref:Uncharacterized protein n=1 Tax=Brachypodium distachyon TaxID=15368 RepID=A0A2K2DGD1_BRADI|nr:hypothetical protein BRADI_2g57288v3 [Brachypodium distachyon]
MSASFLFSLSRRLLFIELYRVLNRGIVGSSVCLRLVPADGSFSRRRNRRSIALNASISAPRRAGRLLDPFPLLFFRSPSFFFLSCCRSLRL